MHFDELAKASLDPNTPPDERWDMNAEIFDARKGFLSAQKLPHPEEVLEAVHELDEWEREWLPRGHPMAKAMVQLRPGLPWTPVRKRRGSHESVLYLNDMGLVGGLGANAQYVERPGAGFEFLRHVGHQVDFLKAVILTLLRQIVAFCVPESDPSPLGYSIVRRDGKKLTEADMPRVRRIEEFLANCGDESNPRERMRLRREDMRGYVHKLMWDSLLLDACPVETQMTRGGKLSGIYNIPGDTVRLCTEDGYEGDDRTIAVQVAQSVPVAAYDHDSIIYNVRNPRAELESMGYGYSETEMMIRALTGYISAINYNHAGLDKNSMPRGILTVFGSFNPRAQQDFRNKFRAMMRGATNRHDIPVMFADPEESGGKGAAVAWTPIDTFDEMMFARWVVLQASLICALHGMDPTEVHFDSFAIRGASPLNSNDIADKIAHSKSKGLEPRLRFVQEHFSQWIIPLIDPDYRLQYIGIQAEDDAKKHERIMSTSTVDEIREMDGKDPHPNRLVGQAPVNPSLGGLYMQTLAMQQQAGAAGPGGGLDTEPPADDEPIAFQTAERLEPTEASEPTKSKRPMAKAEVGRRARRRRRGLVIIERGAA